MFDMLVTSLEPQRLGEVRDALVILDRGTRYIERDTLSSKNSQNSHDGQRVLLDHIGPEHKVRMIHTDAAQELMF